MTRADAASPDLSREANTHVDPAPARRELLFHMWAPLVTVPLLIFLLQLGLTDRLEGEARWVALWMALGLGIPPIVLGTPVLAALRLIGPGARPVERGRLRLAKSLAVVSVGVLVVAYLGAQTLLVNLPLPVALLRLTPFVLLPQAVALWLLAPAIPRLPAAWFPPARRDGDTADETPPPGAGPVSVFLSYAHKDEELKDAVLRQLAVYENNGWVIVWHDRKIVPGDDWATEIDQNLQDAEVVLLFVSPDFLASKYCYWNEMKLALERHHAGLTRVIPVILRPCDWTESPLKGLQAVPKDGKAITEWPNQDAATLDVARHVLRAFRKVAIDRGARRDSGVAAT